MQNTIKSEMHNFILKSCKGAIHDFSFRNDQTAARDAAIIEKYFFEDASIYDLKCEFEIAESNVSVIINGYLEHLSAVARHGGYTSDEIGFISTLLEARRSTRRAFKECAEAIAQCKDGTNQNKLVFSISDPIEKLYELNLISTRTLNCLRAEFGWRWDNLEHNPKITLADIVYIPKIWFYHIPNMGAKSIAEIVGFINDYPIQGRIIPTKEDIKRVLENANIGIDTTNGIISTYYLKDYSIDAMCTLLQLQLDDIQKYIAQLLARVRESACQNNWGMLDLITVSSMLDLHLARDCTCIRGSLYFSSGDYTAVIADKIRKLCHSEE